MTMYRRLLAAVGVVLVVAAVGGFFLLKESAVGPSTRADRAQVTGYAATGASGHASGAVSVELDGAAAARIATIVEGLPRANRRYNCAEDVQEYHITFSADASKGVRHGFALTGYWCDNLVVEVPLHGPTEDRIDRDCTLLSAVRRLLPAHATHSGTCAHADGRLFLAASRHAAPRTETASRKAASRKAATRRTPTHKSPNRETPNRETLKLRTVQHGSLKRTPRKRETLNRGTAVRVMSRRS